MLAHVRDVAVYVNAESVRYTNDSPFQRLAGDGAGLLSHLSAEKCLRTGAERRRRSCCGWPAAWLDAPSHRARLAARRSVSSESRGSGVVALDPETGSRTAAFVPGQLSSLTAKPLEPAETRGLSVMGSAVTHEYTRDGGQRDLLATSPNVGLHACVRLNAVRQSVSDVFLRRPKVADVAESVPYRRRNDPPGGGRPDPARQRGTTPTALAILG